MYKGIFVNKEIRISEEGIQYPVIENESGDNWYDERDNLRPKYVVIVDPVPPYFVCGADEDGYFSFAEPLRVYFLDEIPEDFETVRYCYDGKKFTPFINVEAWRYNELSWLKNQIDEIEDNGGDASHLRQYRISVRAYSGDGLIPELPIRPA